MCVIGVILWAGSRGWFVSLMVMSTTRTSSTTCFSLISSSSSSLKTHFHLPVLSKWHIQSPSTCLMSAYRWKLSSSVSSLIYRTSLQSSFVFRVGFVALNLLTFVRKKYQTVWQNVALQDECNAETRNGSYCSFQKLLIVFFTILYS